MKTAFILTMAIATFAAAAIAADSVGEIVAIEGKASATDVNGKVRQLQLKSAIYLNDTVVTEASSKVQVMFDDSTVVSQGEKSELVIDEYVYSPDKKSEDNCSLRLLKGVFRVVTGKITELNPERFKVRTRMATIGIRGCGLVVKLKNRKEEDIYITQVSEGRSIAIWQVGLAQEIPDGGEWMDGPDVLSVFEAGVAVFVREGMDLMQRRFSAEEAGRVILEATPAAGGGDTGGTGDRDGDGGESATGPESEQDVVGAINDLLATGNENEAMTALEEGVGGTGGEGDGRTDIFAKPSDPSEGPSGAAPTTTPGTGVDLMNTPPFPGVGTDWSWGVFADAGMSYDGNYLTQADFDAIVIGGNTYNLTGTGRTGASLEYNGRAWFVEGNCDLNVTVGNYATPVWDGTFSLARDGNSVDFTADGMITGGTLSGDNITSYSMKVDNRLFNETTLSSHNVGGRLVGPGISATPPISGAVGDYSFDHNNGEAKVRGVYGVDLR